MDYHTYMFYHNQTQNTNQDSLTQSVENAKMYLRELEMTNEYQSNIIGYSKQPIQYYTYCPPVQYYQFVQYYTPVPVYIPPKKSHHTDKRKKKSVSSSLETIPE